MYVVFVTPVLSTGIDYCSIVNRYLLLLFLIVTGVVVNQWIPGGCSIPFHR